MAEKSESLKMSGSYGEAPPTAKRCRKQLSNPPNCEAMESEIWKDFPEDLFEAVNARLPVATFFRFRTVCQKWNSLPSSESFVSQARRGIIPWFYIVTDENTNSGAMYDPCSKKWYPLPTRLSMSLPVETIVLPVASAGGLVCFLDICEQNFYVCNPLTGSFRELPPISKPVEVLSRGAVGMVAFSSTASYRILWVGRDGEHEVYDSVKDSWSRPGNIPSYIKLPLSLIVSSPAISVENTLYFMVSDPEGIVSCDMVTGKWKQLAIPAPPLLCERVLAECKGRIMLAGLLAKNAATCVIVWELQRSTLLWKEVDRMPNLWCLEFYGKNIRMTCLGNKDLLMLSLNWHDMNQLVTYNLASREWHKAPRCSVRCRRKRPWIASGTAFDPSPTAIA